MALRSGPIVVGHDRSAAGDAALRTAIDYARRFEARLHVVHSVTRAEYGIDPDTEAYEAVAARAVERERSGLAEVLDPSGLQWQFHLGRGDPARELCHLAESVDAMLVVIGAGHGGAVHHLLGGDSVPAHLLRHQTRPVLVVPADSGTNPDRGMPGFAR